MRFEERRRKIMAEGLQWGDKPGRLLPRADEASAISVINSGQTTSKASASSSLPLSSINANTILKPVSLNEELSDSQLADMDSLSGPTATSFNGPLSPHGVSRDSETTNRSINNNFVSSKDWEFKTLSRRSRRFREVPRYHFSHSNLSNIIRDHEKTGVPLIIEGWHESKQWPTACFDVDWLREHGHQSAAARNVRDWTDREIMLSDLIDNMRASSKFALPGEKERLYGKDGECPQEWAEWLNSSGLIPSSLLFNGCDDVLKYMPENAKVQTLMYYLGIGDTFTPFHKDLCGSSGQNLMCYTEDNGSSFWFMTEGSSAPAVAEYLHELGYELDLESHVLTVEELEKAPFDVYIAEQALGDLVLVPSRSCHQVVNRGGITIKTSWSRMTIDGLSTALYHELPIYRRVCRPEIYRVKTNIFCAILHYTAELQKWCPNEGRPAQSNIARKLRQLNDLLNDIIIEEYAEGHSSMLHASQSSAQMDSHFACDFCGGDVFQSFFECSSCTGDNDKPTTIGDGIIICPYCYVEGRTCRCGKMVPVQNKHFDDIIQVHDRAEKALEDSGLEDGRKHIYLSSAKNEILSRGHVGVFQAACNLRRSRLKRKADRNCRLRRDDSLCRVPGSVLPCKSCHMGRCFSHILENGFLHSAEALSLYHSDETGKLWHQQHSEAWPEREQAWSAIKQAEEKGSRPDMNHMFAYLATKFVTCKPIKPTHTRHGWYDKNVHVMSIPVSVLDTARHRNMGPSTEAHNVDSSINPWNDSISVNVVFEPLTTDEHMHVLSPVAVAVNPSSTRQYVRASTPVPISSPGSKKRTRAILDCVYIPTDRAVGKRNSKNPPSSSASSTTLTQVEDEEMSDDDDDDDVPLIKLVCPSSKATTPSRGPAIVSQRVVSPSPEGIEVADPSESMNVVEPVAAPAEGPPTKKARTNAKPGALSTTQTGRIHPHRSKRKIPPRCSAITRSSTTRTQSPQVSADDSISGSSGQEKQTISTPSLSPPPHTGEGAEGLVQAFSQSLENDKNAQLNRRSHTLPRAPSVSIQDHLYGQHNQPSSMQSRASSLSIPEKYTGQSLSENELIPTGNKDSQDELGVEVRSIHDTTRLQRDIIENLQKELQSSRDEVQTFRAKIQKQQDVIGNLQKELQNYNVKFHALKSEIQCQNGTIEQVHEEVQKQSQRFSNVMTFDNGIKWQRETISKIRDDLRKSQETIDSKIRHAQRNTAGELRAELQGSNDRYGALESEIWAQKNTIEELQKALEGCNSHVLTFGTKIKELNETVRELSNNIKQPRKETPSATDLFGTSSAEVVYLRSAPMGLGQVTLPVMFNSGPSPSWNDRYNQRDQESFHRPGPFYPRHDAFRGRNSNFPRRYRPEPPPYRGSFQRSQSYHHPQDRLYFNQHRGARLPPIEPRTKMTKYRSRSRSLTHEPRSETGNRSPSCLPSREPRLDTRNRSSSCSTSTMHTINTQFDDSANTANNRHKEKSPPPTRTERDPQGWEDDYDQDPDVKSSSPRPSKSDIRQVATLTDTYASVLGNDSSRIYDQNPWQ